MYCLKINMEKNSFKKIIFGVLLFFVWILLTAWYVVIYDQSFFITFQAHQEENFIDLSHDRLLKGEKISGEFKAERDNLGIVSLRFKKFLRIPYDQEDTLIFRIKEKDSSQWYYENEYRSGLTYDVPFLPFGFPLIPDSKGKIYYFELESLRGNSVNGVVLSEREPILVTKYEADRGLVFSNLNELFNFLNEKFLRALLTIDIFYSSVIFALPLVFYFLHFTSFGKRVMEYVPKFIISRLEAFGKKLFGRKYKQTIVILSSFFYHWMLIILIVLLFFDIFFLQILNDLLYILVIFLWIIILKIYRKDRVQSFRLGIVLLIISPMALAFSNVDVAEKAAVWAFAFFIAGLIQAFLEIRKKRK